MPCVKRMPTRRDDAPGSGCRSDCLHRAMVLAYRATRSEAMEVRKAERELACNGFEAEGAAWDEEHPPAITFRDYLRVNAQKSRVVDADRPTAQEATEMITLTTKTGEARFTLTGAPTDAALATWSIEARNAYLDEIAAEADLAEIEHDRELDARIAAHEIALAEMEQTDGWGW